MHHTTRRGCPKDPESEELLTSFKAPDVTRRRSRGATRRLRVATGRTDRARSHSDGVNEKCGTPRHRHRGVASKGLAPSRPVASCQPSETEMSTGVGRLQLWVGATLLQGERTERRRERTDVPGEQRRDRTRRTAGRISSSLSHAQIRTKPGSTYTQPSSAPSFSFS